MTGPQGTRLLSGEFTTVCRVQAEALAHEFTGLFNLSVCTTQPPPATAVSVRY